MANTSKASKLYGVNRIALQQVEVPAKNSDSPPANNSTFCFIFDRTRNRISLADAYQSTVEPRQRLSYPHLYINATTFDHAIDKARTANDVLRQTIRTTDAEYTKQDKLSAVIRLYNGYVHTDEIDPLALPPQKNITAIRRKRSKKSPGKHTQLSAVINDEQAKASNKPQQPTELDRCKREHKPIVYVAPEPLQCIDKYSGSGGIRLTTLTEQLAEVAASVLGLPPLEHPEEPEPELSEKAKAYQKFLREQEKNQKLAKLYQMEQEREAKYFSL